MKARLRRAWADPDHARALEQLQALVGELDRTHPGAAGSLRDGEMGLRWTAAGMLEAERQFRRIIGYSDLVTV